MTETRYMDRVRSRLHKVPPDERRALNWANAFSTIDAQAEYARSLGYGVRESSSLDIDGTWTVECCGFGELIELTFKRHPATNYLRWHYGFAHGGTNGDRINLLRQARSLLAVAAGAD